MVSKVVVLLFFTCSWLARSTHIPANAAHLITPGTSTRGVRSDFSRAVIPAEDAFVRHAVRFLPEEMFCLARRFFPEELLFLSSDGRSFPEKLLFLSPDGRFFPEELLSRSPDGRLFPEELLFLRPVPEALISRMDLGEAISWSAVLLRGISPEDDTEVRILSPDEVLRVSK